MNKSSLSIVEIDTQLWEKVMRDAEKGKWDFPLTLSSNMNYGVWYSRTKGFHQEPDRDYLSLTEYPFLFDILKEVLSIEPGGARFHIDKNVVRLAKNWSLIVCNVKFV